MGYFRFRRTFRIFPGFRVNVSKSGVSESIGTRGAWLTFGKRGIRSTIGLPGTGISYTEQAPVSSSGRAVIWITVLLVVLILAVLFHT